MTASAHVLVFRPLIELLRRRGDEVEITAREYAQTLQLLELHGLEAEMIGRHGGRSPLGKARSLASRLRALPRGARRRAFAAAPAPRAPRPSPAAPPPPTPRPAPLCSHSARP